MFLVMMSILFTEFHKMGHPPSDFSTSAGLDFGPGTYLTD
jgi:hypothetical protein